METKNVTGLVSVIIVNYNGGFWLTEGVRSVLDSTVPVEVIVVDNASQDDSVSRLRQECGGDARLRILENPDNRGFARANNQALAGTCGDFLLFLNPDCRIFPDTLARLLLRVAADAEVGMAGCLIVNPDGSEQAGCRRSVPTPWRTLVRVLWLDRLFPNDPRFAGFDLEEQPLPDRPVAVEAISGAFMLVRRSALETVGPLDEGYFVHCEDLDWCMRFRLAGYRILFVPDVAIVHAKGVCSRRRPLFVEWHKHKGMVRFYRKFFRTRYPQPLTYTVIAAVWLRFAVKTVLLSAQALVGRMAGRQA